MAILFLEMMEPVGHCTQGSVLRRGEAKGKEEEEMGRALEIPSHAHLAFFPLCMMSLTPNSGGNCVWPNQRPAPPLAFMLMTVA